MSVTTVREKETHTGREASFFLDVSQRSLLKTGGEAQWHLAVLILFFRVLDVCLCQHTLSGEIEFFRPEEESILPHRCARVRVCVWP